ncbi:MAG: hypothetical protein CVV64_05550 [Candidatus Wallbacteria bacterium HGW-Wallbacteria-1]|uniref:Uncharacterized protein n=1 Tax=Candidatus Wallbacteria bacterium HGW-Wallbacteria-1 TaxID=2013854 RepID=A0A2N1PSC4_9BACT|nr:MAG: hypothetical protein CVV64_05550 [Candidatus Wallbacteria bacterium HGW-Wallbacteria-1]
MPNKVKFTSNPPVIAAILLFCSFVFFCNCVGHGAGIARKTAGFHITMNPEVPSYFEASLKKAMEESGLVLLDPLIFNKFIEEAGLELKKSLQDDDIEDICDSLGMRNFLLININKWSVQPQAQSLTEKISGKKRWIFELDGYFSSFQTGANPPPQRHWTRKWKKQRSDSKSNEESASNWFFTEISREIVKDWQKEKK